MIDTPNGGKAILEQILASKEIKRSKVQKCESHSQGSKITIWVRRFEISLGLLVPSE